MVVASPIRMTETNTFIKPLATRSLCDGDQCRDEGCDIPDRLMRVAAIPYSRRFAASVNRKESVTPTVGCVGHGRWLIRPLGSPHHQIIMKEPLHPHGRSLPYPKRRNGRRERRGSLKGKQPEPGNPLAPNNKKRNKHARIAERQDERVKRYRPSCV